MRYLIPRKLDAPDWLLPGWLTMVQAAWLVAGIAGGVWAFHWAPPAWLGWLQPWLVVWLPLFGALAERKVGAWEVRRASWAFLGWLVRPRRAVYRAPGAWVD
jgi:hypothetical protein